MMLVTKDIHSLLLLVEQVRCEIVLRGRHQMFFVVEFSLHVRPPCFIALSITLFALFARERTFKGNIVFEEGRVQRK